MTPSRASCDRCRQRARGSSVRSVTGEQADGGSESPTVRPRPHPLGARPGAVAGISGVMTALRDGATPALPQ